MKPFTYYAMIERSIPKYTSKPLLKNGASATAAEAREYADALEQYEMGIAKYNSELELYRAEQDKRATEFKKDLLQEFGFTYNNSKAQKAYIMAWNRCHSNGFRAVYDEFKYLANLIK